MTQAFEKRLHDNHPVFRRDKTGCHTGFIVNILHARVQSALVTHCHHLLTDKNKGEKQFLSNYHRVWTDVPSNGRNLIAMDSRARKIRLLTVPIGQAMIDAISS